MHLHSMARMHGHEPKHMLKNQRPRVQLQFFDWALLEIAALLRPSDACCQFLTPSSMIADSSSNLVVTGGTFCHLNSSSAYGHVGEPRMSWLTWPPEGAFCKTSCCLPAVLADGASNMSHLRNSEGPSLASPIISTAAFSASPVESHHCGGIGFLLQPGMPALEGLNWGKRGS